jgi:hypothetical protein
VRPLLIASLSFVLGCGPEAELPQLETEHFSFHGELEGACDALGRLYERDLDRIAHELGGTLREPVDVYIGFDEVERRCSAYNSEWDSQLAGCVVSDTEVAATLEGLSLHLVNVIREQHEVRGIPFIEKALPYMLGVGRPTAGFVVSVFNPRDPDYDIAAQLSYGWSDEPLVSIGLAVHFLHWVGQAYGSHALRAWLWSDEVREGTDVTAAFIEATGQSIAVARERWGDESEYEAVLDGFCHGMPAPPLPPEGLFVEASPCCDDPTVEQHTPPLLDVGTQCFTLPVDTEVTMQLLTGEGTLALRSDGCLTDSPMFVELGEASTVTLPACRWIATVIGPERCEEGAEMSYAITPS